jgi:hypothetical protein
LDFWLTAEHVSSECIGFFIEIITYPTEVNDEMGITSLFRDHSHARRRHHPRRTFQLADAGRRIPYAHPIRKIRKVVDLLLKTMDEEFEGLYV